jgi:hypothetical protein
MIRQMERPYEQRRLYKGDDPHGYKLREHPKNAGAVLIAYKHAQRSGHNVTDLMDDTPDGDVVSGMCCIGCDWFREFPYRPRLQPKAGR